jgi:hypothetical protein
LVGLKTSRGGTILDNVIGMVRLVQYQQRLRRKCKQFKHSVQDTQRRIYLIWMRVGSIGGRLHQVGLQVKPGLESRKTRAGSQLSVVAITQGLNGFLYGLLAKLSNLVLSRKLISRP